MEGPLGGENMESLTDVERNEFLKKCQAEGKSESEKITELIRKFLAQVDLP